MDFLSRCFARRKPHSPEQDRISTSHSGPQIPGGDFQTLADLRQKCEENTLSTAEARALLNASGKFNEPLTPREIEELHRILSPAPPHTKPGTSSTMTAIERSLRTPTNEMLPDMQLQSDLFSLPPEVRSLIWRHAIGRRKIYLAVKEEKLVQQDYMQRPYWRGVRGLLSIPLLCRRSYLESISLLYSENTFGFGFGSSGSSNDFFTQADTLLLPQCVAAMTSLEVGFHLSGGYSQYYDSHPQAWDLSLEITAPEPLCNWNSVFKALVQMKQLRRLVVVVWASGDRRHEFMAREAELMDIPTSMTGLTKFDVWLPWDDEDEGTPPQHADQESRPYAVRRQFEDRERFGRYRFAMLQLSRRRLCRLTSSRHVCAGCLSTPHPPLALSLRRSVASCHPARSFSTTIACRDAPSDTDSWRALQVAEDTQNPVLPPRKPGPLPKNPKPPQKSRKPNNKGRRLDSEKSDKASRQSPPDKSARELSVLRGALSALKNVLATQGLDVGHANALENAATEPPEEPTTKAQSKIKPKSKIKPRRRPGTQPPKNGASGGEGNSSSGPNKKKSTPKGRPPMAKLAAKKARPPGRVSPPTELSKALEEKPADFGVPFEKNKKEAAASDILPDTVKARSLALVPIGVPRPKVPSVSYGLERVLFNSGVYQLQDPRSRVYNFDPYLSQIMPVDEFDFNALKQYVTSSKDNTLISIAKEYQKKYTGSTSSMTSMLAHFHFLLSAWRDINTSMLSRGFELDSLQFTRILRAPAAVFLHWKDGTYAIDADKEFDTANILSMLGKSMEKLLTLSKEEYERYRHGSSNQITPEERDADEAFHYTGFQDFMMRSQLDAFDPRVPGTGMFDLKTRAVVSIRMDARGYQKGLGYEIRKKLGFWESYEREYYDMIRSAFLKYSLQVRMGRMDGIFVAFHNTQRIFGFQYVPLEEMDNALHGSTSKILGDEEFKVSLKLLNELLDRATRKWPERSLRLHFETRSATKEAPFMYFFATPTTPEEIAAVQDAGKASVEAFERDILGLVKEDAENDIEHPIEADDTEELDSDQDTPSPAQEIDTFAAWQEAREMVEEAMDDDELGVESVREAIGDALEQSGILRARSLAESREYVDVLLGALIEGTPPSQVDGTIGISEKTAADASGLEEPLSEQAPEKVDHSLPHAPLHPRVDSAVQNSSTPGSMVNTEDTLDDVHLGQKGAEDVTSVGGEGEVEAELDDDIEAKETSQDMGSSALEPVKNLIMRMARNINKKPLSDTAINAPHDDASKLKEFERILGRLISQSRKEQLEGKSDDSISKHDHSSEPEPIDLPSAENIPSETASTPDIKGKETKPEAEDEAELLGLTLTIKNKVNGVYATRPERLTSHDKWTVEYEIQAIDPKRAQNMYRMLKARRRQTLDHSDVKDRDDEWYKMFKGQLERSTRKGRAFRKKETKKAKGQPIHVVGREKPLKWEDVFPRRQVSSQTSNESLEGHQKEEGQQKEE
ncbi:Pet127-domain-containing protein [Xylaria palmicola]|nr:Pet127-domain-containing protein [Xylaria palmicola]